MKIILLLIGVCWVAGAHAQGNSFPFGRVTYTELGMKVYERDTSAVAVVLNEFGEAYFENADNFNLLFNYHVKIKILKKAGLERATIEIPLHKQDGRKEELRSVVASAFTLVNSSMKEFKLENKSVFTENRKYFDLKKFALPNVQVGSVIEIQYLLESPFIYNFRTWEFQSDIPKVYSEYWPTIPGNYIYNIALKGFLNLSKKEDELVKECFTPGGDISDCLRYKFAMKDIPAFVEEDYMTAKSNFLSVINFELSEIKYFDGRIDKITKEWKDVEDELRRNENFGIQIKRGRNIVDEHVEEIIGGETDPLMKAKKIYDFIKFWYHWDEQFSKYSEFGIKKAFDKKEGNVGDINLSLIAALKYAEFNVEPVILSTRANGLATELHPVLSDFNYVIAKLNLADKIYLLDATDDYLSFGMIPERCLNGKGRVIGDRESYWYELKPTDKRKKLSMLSLKLEADGLLSGTIQNTYIGYDAVRTRRKISSFQNQQEYIDDLNNKSDKIKINKFEFQNLDNLEKALVEKLDVEILGFDDMTKSNFLFNPFILDKLDENPFKSSERLYPVDFGAPLDLTTMLTLEYPAEFQLDELPAKEAIALPNNGGRYIFDIQNMGNKISLNSSLLISKTVFSSTEYHYLKELFSRIIQIQNGDLYFKRK